MALLSNRLRAAAWQTSLALLDSLPSTRRASARHLETGKAGEEAAFFYLRSAGFTVVAHDWRSGRAPGDLDLVAWEGDVLCFIEVKTRSSRTVATAEAAVDRDKRRTLRHLAGYYLRQLPEGTQTRFDVLSVYLQPGKPARQAAFELYRNNFGWQE